MARQKLIHLHGSGDFNSSAVNIDKGEIVVEHGTGAANVKLWTLDETGAKVAFVSLAAVNAAVATAVDAEADRADAAEKANAAAITALETAYKAADTALQGEIDDAENRIATLEGKVGTGEDSVAAQIEAAVAAEAAIARAAEKANADAIDAIEADYLKAADKTALNNLITGLTETVNANETDIEAKMSAEITRAKAAEAAAEANAKEYANGLASNYDAAGSAATAEANAKAYVDTKDAAMDTRVKALEAIDHEHANKAELDKIADGDKAKWDTATNRINTFMDSEEISGTVDTLHEINNWITSAGANATDLSTAIANEKKAREDADTAIRTDFAAADTATLNSAKADATEKANAAEANAKADATTKANTAEANAKAHANGLAKNYDAAGSAATAEANAKTYADGLNTAMDTRVDALEAKFGTGDGSVSDQIADAIAAEVTRSNKYADDAEADALAAAKTYADQAEADAVATAKTYTDGRETAITTAFTTAINNAIAAIDLEGTDAGENTGIGVTVNITDGKTMTVTVDDSSLIIDCGTY